MVVKIDHPTSPSEDGIAIPTPSREFEAVGYSEQSIRPEPVPDFAHDLKLRVNELTRGIASNTGSWAERQERKESNFVWRMCVLEIHD